MVRGNDQIVEGLRDRLPGQFKLGMRLRKTAAGRIELPFAQGASIKEETFEAVVLALPFTTLREVDLDPILGLTVGTSGTAGRFGTSLSPYGPDVNRPRFRRVDGTVAS